VKQSDSFLSLLLNDIISEVQTTWRAIDLEYRIKYIFKGTRDKGHEIADCHGTYMLYDNMQREEMSSPPEYLEEGFEFPELPETEYLTFNKDNSQMRGMAKNDKEHTHLPVTDNTGTNDDVDNYPLTEAVWIETEMPQAEYDLEEDKFPLVGTELANFLNFDIDCFMNGGYRLLWEAGKEGRGSHIVGWKKTEGFDLSKPWVRPTVNSFTITGNDDSDDGLHDSIPFFIRMFGCRFINKEKWEYDLEEVQKIKDLQERLKVFCGKVFFPKDKNDKRSNFVRYCQEIKEISKKELRSMIPKGWSTSSSLEQALSKECYAMIKGNVNLFICEGCGMYTVSDDKRSRLCNRRYYDGSMYDEESNVIKVYNYICKDEKYQRDAYGKGKSDIIENIIQHERKRLYHHLTDNIKLKDYDIWDALRGDFRNVTEKYKEEYQNKISSAESEELMIQAADEYLKRIEEDMDLAISERLGILREDYRFGKRKYKKVTSLEGNIYK
jgi:hypothetical protein